MLKRFVAVILAAAAVWAPQLSAQGYPNKPIRVVIGYAPGGAADAGIRPLARVLEPLLGQPMIIGPAMTDLMGGQVPMLFSSYSTAWYGLVGPAGLAPEVISRLSQALLKAGEDRNLREQLNATGCDADFLSPAQTVERIKTDLAKWGRVVKQANIKVD